MYIHAKLHFAPKHSSKKAPDLDSLHSMVLSMGKDHFQGLLVVLTLIPTILEKCLPNPKRSKTVTSSVLLNSIHKWSMLAVGSWMQLLSFAALLNLFPRSSATYFSDFSCSSMLLCHSMKHKYCFFLILKRVRFQSAFSFNFQILKNHIWIGMSKLLKQSFTVFRGY